MLLVGTGRDTKMSSQSSVHVLLFTVKMTCSANPNKIASRKNNIFLHAMGFGTSIFFPCLVNIFLFSGSKGHGKKQDWTTEIVATYGQNIEKEIVRAILCLELVVWQAFPMSLSFGSRRLL